MYTSFMHGQLLALKETTNIIIVYSHLDDSGDMYILLSQSHVRCFVMRQLDALADCSGLQGVHEPIAGVPRVPCTLHSI